MNRYWISWTQKTEDYRPLHFPPIPYIKGWWCTGYDGNDNAILCAVVQAHNEKTAEFAITWEWPEQKEKLWRFFERKEEKFMPSVDRFPLSGWMKKRSQ